MVVSKPKLNTLFSISMFVVLAMTGGIWGLLKVVNPPYEWYHRIMAILLLPISFAMVVKTVLNWKTFEIGKEKLVVKTLLFSKKRKYSLNEMDHWEETEVKTLNGLFKELTMVLEKKKKVKLNNQEYSEYKRVFNYLSKKYPKKRKK